VKLKHLILALGLVSVAGMANATTTAVGTVEFVKPMVFQGFAAPGPFNDIFTFNLPANGGSGYSVINFSLPALGGSFNSLLATMSLVSNADGILFNADDMLLSSTSSGGPDSLGLTWGPSAAGSYYLNITGISNGTVGGLYSGAISVTPVPEPETWAMLLAGLGIVALKLSRSSNARKTSIN